MIERLAKAEPEPQRTCCAGHDSCLPFRKFRCFGLLMEFSIDCLAPPSPLSDFNNTAGAGHPLLCRSYREPEPFESGLFPTTGLNSALSQLSSTAIGSGHTILKHQCRDGVSGPTISVQRRHCCGDWRGGWVVIVGFSHF